MLQLCELRCLSIWAGTLASLPIELWAKFSSEYIALILALL